MGEATLLVESDECKKCYNKIQNVICKGRERAWYCSCTSSTEKKDRYQLEKITKISYDETKNTVTISGSFDPSKLSSTLWRKAGDAICDITIVVKPEQKKEEEKKKPDEDKKKPDEKKKKPDEEKKKPDEEKEPPASRTTVNLQFTQICIVCYPWPCSDPSHVHQYPQQQHHRQPYQPLPWAPPTPIRTCGGPAYCGGGCGSCGGMQHGWPAAMMPTPLQMMQPPPMCVSGGPLSCRGCRGCRITQAGKFSYQDYPQKPNCTVM